MHNINIYHTHTPNQLNPSPKKNKQKHPMLKKITSHLFHKTTQNNHTCISNITKARKHTHHIKQRGCIIYHMLVQKTQCVNMWSDIWMASRISQPLPEMDNVCEKCYVHVKIMGITLIVHMHIWSTKIDVTHQWYKVNKRNGLI